MNLYISDLHFGHSNVIDFDHRPFADRDEMDRVMISLWNERVSADDHVYIVGDFCYRNGNSADWYLRQLKGHKHICLCHFPIAEWNGYHKGHWHIYGHIHARLDDTYYFMRNRSKALNAAACINNYAPASLNELIRNNQYFREKSGGVL